ncbi:MAG TPA: TonB-dependent receptor [Acetobacteraceae bacterium]|jgi:vitamin B12 transporter|nr:TonB-dependent receptor [Acetobacteraceae bacterium]
MRPYRALTVLALITATPAAAEDTTQTAPDMVVTATRIPTSVENIAAGVTVIDRADIEAHGYNSLTQALADVPGVHVSPSGGLGGQTSVFIRGMNSNHVLVLRDGMPISDAADPTAAYNFGIDTLSDVERIEIIRGPMAALYGSGAIGGVINLISRRGTQQGVHWSGDLAGGYPALVRGNVTASGVEGPIDFALTAESQSQRGYDSIPQRESVYTGVPQGFRDRILTLNLGYTPIEGTRLSLFARAQTAYFGFDTLGSPTYDDSNSIGHTASLLGRVGGTTRLFDGRLESGLFVGRAQEDRRYLEPLAPADPNQTSADDRYHAYRTDVQWNNTLHLDDFVNQQWLSASAMTFGYEYTGDTAKVRTNDNYGGYPYAESALASMVDDALYAGVQTTVLQRLTMTGQVRHDWVDGASPSTWRLGAVYELKEIASHLKFAYGTGFRAPSLYDRYGIDSSGFVGNPTLKPEQSQGWEAGFITDVGTPWRVDFLTFGATYFDQRVRDLIVGVFSPIFTDINLGSAHVHGVETEATLRPAYWAELHAGYTLLNTTSVGQSSAVGSQLLRRPQNEASFDLTLKPMTDLRIITTVIYTGSAHDYLYDNSGNGIGYGAGQHGLVANMAANYKLKPQVELYLNGWNILNSKFEPVNGFQMPGPTVLAGIRFTT